MSNFSKVLKAAVSYEELVAAVRWVDMRMEAIIDLSGRYKAAKDELLALDEFRTQLLKRLRDEFGMSDSRPILFAQKKIAENLPLQEWKTFSFVRKLSESQTVTDTAKKTAIKKMTDSFSHSDSVKNRVDKKLIDEITFSESFRVSNGVNGSGKPLEDTTQLTEAIKLNVSRMTADALGLTEYGAILVQDYVQYGYFEYDYVGQGYYF